jgi:hypothetical protein
MPFFQTFWKIDFSLLSIIMNEVPDRTRKYKFYQLCDQKMASDSSGLSGGFSGQRAWVRKIKNGRQAAMV